MKAAAQAASAAGGSREERKKAAAAALAASAEKKAPVAAEPQDADEDNATLYGLLRLRFNDDSRAPSPVFPELGGCALIRELHVYGTLVAAGREESSRSLTDDRPQHIGIGKTLMGTAELIAAAQGFEKISVIAGVGVRNYYRKLGYCLRGDGQYLIKELPPCPESERGRKPQDYEASFLKAAMRLQNPRSSWALSQGTVVAIGVGMALLAATALIARRQLKKA